MTPLQKSFEAFIAEFKRICEAHGGKLIEDNYAIRFEFKTAHGTLKATIHRGDYDSHKTGFVSIFMIFGNDADVPALAKWLPGDFNQFSGKWNIHTGHHRDKAGVKENERLAFLELESRLNLLKVK